MRIAAMHPPRLQVHPSTPRSSRCSSVGRRRRLPVAASLLASMGLAPFALAGGADGDTNTVVWWGDWPRGDQAWVEPLGSSIGVAVGLEHAISVDDTGTVLCWGEGFAPPEAPGPDSDIGNEAHDGQSRVPDDLGTITMVAAGDTHSLALDADGTVRAWGRNLVWYFNAIFLNWESWTSGQCDVPDDLPPIVRIAAGADHSMALDDQGVVHCWGMNGIPFLPEEKFPPPPYQTYYGQCDVPTDLEPVVRIAGGGRHSVALEHDGEVRCWGLGGPGATGAGNHGQSTVPSDLGEVVEIAAGRFHTVALLADGSVRCWGAGETDTGTAPDFGQCIVPADLGPAIAIAAGRHHTVALLADGGIRRWGEGFDVACAIPPDPDSPFVAIDAQGDRTIARRADGRVFAWSACDPDLHEVVPGDRGRPVAVDAGADHVVALFEDGSVTAAGAQGYWFVGPFLDLDWIPTTQASVPVLPGPVESIASGPRHNLVVLEGGGVAAWGDDCDRTLVSDDPPEVSIECWGAIDVPDDLPPARAVAAGTRHSVALLVDGGVRCWGDNRHGQCDVPGDLEPVVAIAAGLDFTVAIEWDGDIRCWGDGVCHVPSDPPAGPLPARTIDAQDVAIVATFVDGSVTRWNAQTGAASAFPRPMPPAVDAKTSDLRRSMILLADGGVRVVNHDGGGSFVPTPEDLPSLASIAIDGGGSVDGLFGIPGDPRPIEAADLDLDGRVDGTDLAIMLALWGECAAGSACAADLDRNGRIDAADLTVLLAAWQIATPGV